MSYSFNRNKLIFCIYLVLWLFISSCSANKESESYISDTAQNNSDNNIRLRVQNRQIVDGNGNNVRLRGIYTRAEWLSSEDEVKNFKNWGINFVRILLTYDKDYWQVFNNGEVDLNKRCILREENLLEMDKKCSWLEANGIYFIIEFPWRWYGIDQEFQKPSLLSQQCARLYSTLTKRYKDFDYLVAYSMFSEIYVAPEYYKDYKKICTDIIDAVRRDDPERIMSVNGVQVSGVDSFKDETHIERPSVIYDFHYYWVKSFTHYRPWYGDMRYPGRIPHGYSGCSFYQDRAFHESMIEQGLAYSRKWNVPLWCGEFGAFGNAPDGSSDRWIQDVSQILEKNNIPWIIWTWRKGSTDVPELWKELWRGKPDNRATINPHGGTFVNPLSVKIETWVPGSQIRYTTDGSDPTADSALYTVPFRITENTVVKARVFANKMTDTPIDAAVFKMGGRKADNPQGRLGSGLRFKYLSGAMKKIYDAEIEALPVLKEGIEHNLDGGPEGHSLIYNGFLKIEEAGRYFFYPEAYGAYKVYIGDILISQHNVTKYEWDLISAGIITLEPGIHKIKVFYSRPQGILGGFKMRLQQDSELIEEPLVLKESMLYHMSEVKH
jgi:hypothetical protein